MARREMLFFDESKAIPLHEYTKLTLKGVL